MKKLRLETATAAMKVITEQNSVDAAMKMGNTEADYNILIGPKPWLNDDKHRVKRILESLMSGMIDKLGLPPIQLPAEYAAGVIALFVHPCNYFAACAWVGKHTPNSDLANFDNKPEEETGLEFVTPRQLFALILEIRSDDTIDILARNFEEKTARQLGVPKNEKKPESK